MGESWLALELADGKRSFSLCVVSGLWGVVVDSAVSEVMVERGVWGRGYDVLVVGWADEACAASVASVMSMMRSAVWLAV